MNIIFSSSQQSASLDDNDLLKSATNLIFSLATALKSTPSFSFPPDLEPQLLTNLRMYRVQVHSGAKCFTDTYRLVRAKTGG